jgi:type I restriction enzyme S subunit
MKYQAYPEYKDSGVEWLEDVPEHWNIKRTKAMFTLTRTLVGKQSKDYQLLSLTLKGIVHRDISDGGGKIPAEFDTYQEVQTQDLVFCLFDIDETPRTIGLSSHNGMITGAYNVYRCLGECVPEYTYYYFMHIDSFKGLKPFYTGLRKVVRSETFSNIKMPAPNCLEQQKISNFLGHETAKIDTLIEKQQRLIKLLKEKRQSVISHTVTKGLNPNVLVRDSGVEWLGEVPEHWDICFIKYKCQEITDGANVSPITEGGERYFVSITDIKNGVINFDDALLTSQASFEYLIKTGCMPFAGDILFSKDGTIGQTAITPEGFEFVVASSLIIIRPNQKKVISQYLDFLLQSDVVVEQVESFVKGAALRRISIQNLLKVGGAFPPVPEQMEICSYLTKLLERYDELESRANNLIKLQQERRTALISAAVTGKIDVRNWQAPEPLHNNNEISKEEAA